jgi:hypothetical protein
MSGIVNNRWRSHVHWVSDGGVAIGYPGIRAYPGRIPGAPQGFSICPIILASNPIAPSQMLNPYRDRRRRYRFPALSGWRIADRVYPGVPSGGTAGV